MRLMILSWLLSAFVLKNYYCGELFGLMAVTAEPERMETIDAFATAFRTGPVILSKTFCNGVSQGIPVPEANAGV